MTRVHLQGYVFGYGKKEGLCSLLSVPMMVRDKAVGVLTSEGVKVAPGHRQSGRRCHRAYDPDREVP